MEIEVKFFIRLLYLILPNFKVKQCYIIFFGFDGIQDRFDLIVPPVALGI